VHVKRAPFSASVNGETFLSLSDLEHVEKHASVEEVAFLVLARHASMPWLALIAMKLRNPWCLMIEKM